MKSLFITGTDTGVGKTLVTALLALHFRSRGIDCGVMKPFASGCEWQNGALVSEDALFLRDATSVEDELDFINPIRLQEPLAPLMAARSAGTETGDFFERAHAAFQELQARHEMVLVEGVGGLLVPIAERNGRILTCRDLIEEWNLPVIVVARRTLGTINHTLLTLEALRGADVRGLVLCDAEPVDENDVAAQTSPAIIAEMTGLPIWGQVPFLDDLSRDELEGVARKIKTA
jgi:dethiobiotin synthetase